MASFMHRIRKLFKRRPKQQQSNTNTQQASTDSNKPEPAQQRNQQPNQDQQVLATDGANDRAVAAEAATTSGRLTIALRNETNSSLVFAYITGQAIDRNNALFLLSSDGRTGIFPSSPAATGTKLAQSPAIRLGAPGSTINVSIPRLAGGRIWFSIGRELSFAVNPGPGLVEPSVFNDADPNTSTDFGFAEFTFNSAQVFANISYVDFIAIPIALTLRDTNGQVQRVGGLRANGIEQIAEGLRAQTRKDGRRWGSLVVPGPNGRPLRILSPNSALLLHPGWFHDYWQEHVDRVWDKYRVQQLTVDTQAAYGKVNGQVRADGLFDFGGAGTFAKPSTRDIFSCSTGPFATGSNAERNAVIPRLAAAFNRSTLLLSQETPNGTRPAQYYETPITNHYSRIVHEANINGQGYAFPYDDVTPNGGTPQEGAVFSFSPQVLTVTVGGNR